MTAHASATYSVLCTSFDSVSDETVYRSEGDAKLACLGLSAYHKLFCTAKGIDIISRMLLAYGALHPKLGYVKGLHHVAGVMILVFGREREEDAFWTMVAFMENRLLPNSQGQVRALRGDDVTAWECTDLLHASSLCHARPLR